MKKAYLVEFTVRTRIVAEEVETEDSVEFEDMVETAVDKILENPTGYINSENLEDYQPDTDMPYDENGFDKV